MSMSDEIREATRNGAAGPAMGVSRPRGGVVWFHAGHATGVGPLLGVIRRVAQERPDLSLLVTSARDTIVAEALPRQCLPQDTSASVARFLDLWRPDAAFWAGPLDVLLRPRALDALRRRGVPLVLSADGGAAPRSFWRWWRRPARGMLSAVTAALADAPASATELLRLGLPRNRVQVAGPLAEENEPPSCDEGLRASLAGHLGGRPIWFAAHLLPGEDELVLRAHETSLRAARRLLLVLAPADPDRGPALARRLTEEGRTPALRSAGEMPDTDREVVLADRPGEAGLWYRLAPVSFLGGSLLPGGGQDPGPAAALGSAILHGPHVARHLAAYERLARAGGARLVTGAEALGTTLTHTIRPEEAARMAHAAWQVWSAGAEVAERAVALLRPMLPAPARA